MEHDDRYSHLRILALDDHEDATRLRYVLSGEWSGALSDLDHEWRQADGLDASDGVGPEFPSPANAIHRLATGGEPRGLGAQCALIEGEYTDRDTNLSYQQLAARAFRDMRRRVTRLHFFREPVVFSDLRDISRLQDTYLGFVVLPQTRPLIIGRTVLPAAAHDGVWTYVPATSKFSINLAGAPLDVEGTAFIEQDDRVAACATAAAWMSTVILSKRWGDMPVRSMAEITGLATAHSLSELGGGSPPGLKVDQLRWALREMGYESQITVPRDSDAARQVLHQYVESGIQPILVVHLSEEDGFHAVTAVGHTYDEMASYSGAAGSEYCPDILVHDDRLGPYVRMRIGPVVSAAGGRPSVIVVPDDADENREAIEDWYEDATLHYIIAPMPPRYTVRPEDAFDKGQEVIERFFQVVVSGGGTAMPERPIWRSYFIASNELKRRLLEAPVFGEGKLAALYAGSLYPRYVWVTELSDDTRMRGKPPKDHSAIAVAVIDPTSTSQAFDFVVGHVGGSFFKMPPDADAAVSISRPFAHVAAAREYPSLVREGVPPA